MPPSRGSPPSAERFARGAFLFVHWLGTCGIRVGGRLSRNVCAGIQIRPQSPRIYSSRANMATPPMPAESSGWPTSQRAQAPFVSSQPDNEIERNAAAMHKTRPALLSTHGRRPSRSNVRRLKPLQPTHPKRCCPALRLPGQVGCLDFGFRRLQLRS